MWGKKISVTNAALKKSKRTCHTKYQVADFTRILFIFLHLSFIQRNKTGVPLPTGIGPDAHLIPPFARKKIFLGKEKRLSEHPARRKCWDALTPQRPALSIYCRLPGLEGYESTSSVTKQQTDIEGRQEGVPLLSILKWGDKRILPSIYLKTPKINRKTNAFNAVKIWQASNQQNLSFGGTLQT